MYMSVCPVAVLTRAVGRGPGCESLSCVDARGQCRGGISALTWIYRWAG